MAVSDITATVLRITGVTPTANSVEDGQRFVVSSVPKELLKWSSTFTVPGNHGGNTSDGVKITMPTGTDSVLDVSRNGFSATEVPYEMKGFIANTASLHLATNTYPKYYLDDANPGEGVRIIVKPIPTDSETAIALYVDFSKIDDDCDLRNAVIYHTSAHEFTKLGSDELPTISINAVPPDTPGLPTITSPGIATIAKSDISGDVPTYTKPTQTTQVSFEDFFNLTEDGNPFGDNDPGAIVVTAVPPDSISDTIADFDLSTSDFDDAMLNAKNLIDNDVPASGSDVFDLLSDEDTELVQATLQTAAQEIQRANVELQSSLQTFNTDMQKFQASGIGKFNADVAAYQADVNTQVQDYSQKLARYQLEVNTVSTSWAKTESDNLQVYQLDIQNELNEFNKDNIRYQANIQAEITKAQIDAQEAQKEGDLTLQAAIQDYTLELQKFQADVNEYSTEVQSQVQEYQNKIQKQQSYSKEADKYYQWANAEVQMYIQNNSKMINRTIAAQASAQQQGAR